MRLTILALLAALAAPASAQKIPAEVLEATRAASDILSGYPETYARDRNAPRIVRDCRGPPGRGRQPAGRCRPPPR